MDGGPWTRLTSRPVCQNPRIAVREDQVITPTGSRGIYGVVHRRNRAAGILPVDDRGQTVPVGQYRYTLDSYSWEIPAGGVPEGESLLAGAQRELHEETGLVAKDWLDLAEHSLSNSVTDERCRCLLAWNLDPSPGSSGRDRAAGLALVARCRSDRNDSGWAHP